MHIEETVYERPWGQYIKILEEDGFWVKRVEVKAGQRLSLQKHTHRSEKWNIVLGKGLVTLNKEEKEVVSGDLVDVPIGAEHRIKNTGKDPLVFIEIAYGKNLSEEDIERIQDDYERTPGLK